MRGTGFTIEARPKYVDPEFPGKAVRAPHCRGPRKAAGVRCYWDPSRPRGWTLTATTPGLILSGALRTYGTPGAVTPDLWPYLVTDLDVLQGLEIAKLYRGTAGWRSPHHRVCNNLQDVLVVEQGEGLVSRTEVEDFARAAIEAAA